MGFYDLCITAEDGNEDSLRELLQKLYEQGYRTVAINQNIDENVFLTEEKKKKKTQCQQTKIIPRDLNNLKVEFEKKLVLLNRISFSFADSAKTHLLSQSSGFKYFDLYAVIPKDRTAFQFACTQLNADIITVNSKCNKFQLSRKLYMQAIERGVHFEIQYADLISPKTRQTALGNSHLFHIYGKSKNIIISSGAKDSLSIRNPYDIINLGALLGLSEIKSKSSILDQCKYLILKAEGRRYGKAVFAIQPVQENLPNNNEESNDERLPACKKLKLVDL